MKERTRRQRRMGLWCAAAVALVACSTVSGQDYIWFEGEAPTRANITVGPSAWGNQQYLSGEKWLNVAFGAGEVEEKLPEGGAILAYDFQVRAGGDYEVWNRIGFEFARSAFDWRLDDGQWQTVAPDMLTTDLMEIAFWNEVAWLKMGAARLDPGTHTLEIRHKLIRDAEGKPQRVLYASDAFCLYRGEFRPNSGFKPDDAWQTEEDRAAGLHVFDVKAPEGPGKRSTTPLDGTWQIARADEQVIQDRLGPMAAAPPADRLYWRAARVPGDRNVVRPDMVMCHRYFYRTRVRVPAETEGRSFLLHFPSTNMVVTVFVNGRRCGWNKAPFAVWDCDITEAVRPGQVNEIWVGVKDTYYGLSSETRRMFNIPLDLLDNNQGVAHRFDMPVWHHSRNGILETPSLVVAGRAYVADVFAMPSVRRKRLGLEVTVADAGGRDADVTVTNEVVPLDGGAAEKKFRDAQVTVPAGGSATLKLTESWENPRLWWPDDPQQYQVVTRLYVGGELVDTRRTKFGFREWEWQSPVFKLNGIPWQGRADLTQLGAADPEEAVATWRKNGQTMFRFWGTSWAGMGMGETLDFMDSHGVPVRRSGIFDGEMASYALAKREMRDGENVKVVNKALFDNWIHQLKAQARGERNHPSIFIWSVENEIIFINANNLGNLDVVEPEVARAVREVMRLDPTRPAMVDGGRALTDMSLPVNGCHYNDPADRDLPDQAYTMEKIYDGKSRGKWLMRKDRPVFFGEAFYAMGRKPSGYAGVGGEVAFLGRAHTKEGVARLCRMMSEGYRWHGLAAFHYWLSDADSTGHYNSWQPVCVLSRQWNWTFGGGAAVSRTLKVLNDTRHPDPIEMGWQFTLDGRQVAQDRATFNVPPGGGQVTEITFQVPQVSKRTRGEFILTCSRGGKEVFREVKEVWVIDPDGAPRPEVKAGEITVLDPHGSAKARLAARGIPFSELDAVSGEPPPGAKLLIVGKDALSAREATDPKWKTLAASGLRILVLDQAVPLHYQAVPADLEPTRLVGRIAFSENLQHPVFDGLDQPDFFTWSGDHVVYRNVYRKASRGARSLAHCDGELRCSALSECAVEGGLLLLSQFAIGDKLATDPVAGRLFDNMVNYCLSYRLVRKATASAVPQGTPLARLLDEIELVRDPTPDVVAALGGEHQIVVATADPATLSKLAQNKARVDAFTERGGYLMLFGLTPEGLADFNRIVGVEHLIRPFERERVTLPGARDPVLSGLTTRDVVMESAQKIFSWRADRWMSDDAFTYIVDLDDVAPFAEWPAPAHWMQEVTGPGDDHWPRNMVNGFVTDDGWRYIFSILLSRNEPAKWTIKLPRQEEVIGFSIAPNAIYHRLTKMTLTFDGGRKVELDVRPDNSRQDFDFAGIKARAITFELTEWEKKGTSDVIGVDNLWLRVRRSPEFQRRVTPLLNIGGLVKYSLGTGGVILNQLNIKDREEVPENRQKKATITATLLRNLGAVFAGKRQIVPGAGLKYDPVPLGDKCNQFLTAGRDHWFRDAKGRALDHFPIGEQKLAGVRYLVRDFTTSPLPSCVMLQVGGRNGVPGAEWEVKDIPVDRKADALFFLHTFNRTNPRTPRNYRAAFRYVVHYADGETEEILVRLGREVGHWALPDPQGMSNAALAWAQPFRNDRTEQAAVYQMQWDNPRPEVTIRSIDMGYDPQSNPRAALGQPALLAVTAATRAR